MTWPTAGTATIDISAAGRATAAGAAAPGGLPVTIRPNNAGDDGPALRATAWVEVLERTTAKAVGVDGILLQITADNSVREATVEVDYSAFAHAYGGDWASRLRLVRMPDCAVSTPARKECQARTPIESSNDPAAGTVTATVDLTGGGPLLALTADASGPAGDWSATPLSASATWQVSAQTGDFSWAYPLRVPPAVGGPAPQLALSYSSGSVDGRVASTNNQTSWVGDGWEMWGGYVERKYAACADDDTSGANNVGHETGDLCWRTDNATLVLNGSASELVRDESTGGWRLRSDDGSRVQRLTGGTNADNNTEYWKVTTTDGTQYFFGVGKRYASDTDRTNSTWTVPVFGNHSGEPCHQAAFADSHCPQAWRWNLDYVVDPRGNTITYFYTAETNNYGRDLNDAVSSYDRGGVIHHIDYGERAGSEHTTSAPAQVWFDVSERCLTNCGSLTGETADNWPDVPYDLICSSTSSCPDVLSPAFFTRKRLTSVTTKVWNGAGYDNVDTWRLAHAFPDPGDGTSNPVLWLNSIEHQGIRSGAPTLAPLPKVVFTGVQMPNRVDTAGDLGPAMIRYRMSSIDTETGGRITINYDPADCTPTSLPSSPESNTRRCMPVYWTPDGYQDPVLEYFHKYRVDTVAADPDPLTEGDPAVETDYVYVGGSAWHYDDNELVPAKYRTWGQFRGYSTVDVIAGNGISGQSRTRYRFFRGMDDDRLPGGARRQVQVDGIDDHDRYAGFTREQITYDGPSGPEVAATVNTPWLSPPTATAADGTTARLLGTGTVETRTTAPALPGGIRRTTTVSSFDSTYGMAIRVDDQGDTSTTADDLCIFYSYARNTSLWIVDRVSRTEVVSARCGGTISRPGDVVSDTRLFYDNPTAPHGSAPTKGLVVKTEQVKSYNGSTPVYVTESTTAYDAHGRVTRSADALGRTTTTAYTPATGGPLTRTTVTSPDPDGTGSLTPHITVTDLDPAFGVPKTVTDPNSKVTQASYDALGRLLKVWEPGRTTAQTPNLEFSYLIRTNGPNAVTTKKLIHNGAQLPSIQLFDGLLRPRQTQATAAGDEGGRVITDTRYDARDLVSAENHEYFDTGAPSTNLFIPSTVVPGRTEYTYDGADRVTVEAFLKQGVEAWRTTTTYGGDRVSVDPPDGGTPTTTISDARGRTIQLWQYLGGSPAGAHRDTTYAYDHAGRLATVTDPVGNSWSYGYDLLGRQVTASDPDKGTTSSTYDDAGQVTSTTDARGEKLWYVYDALGRKVELRDDSATGAVRAKWVYDTLAKGQLSSSTRYDGSAQYTVSVTGYDNGYRPLGQSVTLPSTGVPAGEAAIAGTYTTRYTYTVDGQLKTLKHPAAGNLGAETVTTYYDAVSMPSYMGGGLGWGAYVAGSDWSVYGDPLLLDLGNTYFFHVGFDYETGTNRLQRLTLLRQNVPGVDLDATYTYDDAGNVTSIVDRPTGKPVDAQCYAYDGLRRLTEAWTPGNADCNAAPTVAGLGGPAPYWTTYSFDPVGNRVGEVRHAAAGDTTRAYAYPASGSARPHAVSQVTETGPGGSKTHAYGYDRAGNTICRPAGAASNACPATASQTLTYDAEGRLAAVTAGGVTGGYVYTADGERLIRRENGVTTVYLPGGQELRLTVATGAKTATRYYSFAGSTVAVRTGAGLAGVTTLVSDHHGTAELAVHNTTNVLTRRRHDPYGRPRGAAPAWPGDHGFLDKPADATGLTHIGARQYDPAIGRFTSVDPVMDLADPQQWHGYAYANNNPVTWHDPTGLAIPECDGGCSTNGGNGQVAIPTAGGGHKITGRPSTDTPPPNEPKNDVTEAYRTQGLTTSDAILQSYGIPPGSIPHSLYAPSGMLPQDPFSWADEQLSTECPPEYQCGVVFFAWRPSFSGLKGLWSRVRGLLGAKASASFTTKPNTAFFWSGRTGRVGGADVAADLASAHRGTTLEQLVAKRGIKLPVWDASDPASMAAWDAASLAYAQGASGTVRAVIGSSLRPGNTWERIELPALKRNPNVTQIIKIDPATKVETVIFKR